MHEEEYNDLYKIAVLGTVPDSRSWSQKVSQRVLEYAAVATVVAVLQYGLCSQGFCKSIPDYCSNIQSYLTGNGSTTGDSTAVAPMAHGLYQAQTTEAPGLLQGLVGTLTTAAKNLASNVVASNFTETRNLTETRNNSALETLVRKLAAANMVATSEPAEAAGIPPRFAEISFDMAYTASKEVRGAFMEAVSTVCEKWNMAAADLETVLRRVPTQPSTFMCPKLPTMSFAELNRPGLFVDPGTGWDLQRLRASFSKCVDMDFNPEKTDIWLGALGPEWAPRHRTCGRASEGTLMCRGLGVSNPQCFDFHPEWENYPGGLGFLIDMIDRIFRPMGDEDCVVRCGGSDTGGELWLKNAEERDAVRNAMSGRINLGDACTREGLEHFVQAARKMYTQAVTRKYPPDVRHYHTEDWRLLSRLWFKAPCGAGIWKPGEPLPTCACAKFSISCETDNHFKISYTARTPEIAFAALPPGLKLERCVYQCLTKI
ncbi:hypothetical protein GNI_120130 [Gregarina niphandrodes]|uniref:Uncharacterized protein n=1 Tax=Gregarina niphandrodes TaxID=110365 RepID=A0A023B2L6_GRENI|nr:hypothetical protein GNI_120130 [Gregarina niphandrodes]EZG54770.1 hypothetical protein GNI_120130 [Gregarina niphandrodes]|eukprot:XP_011131830.1 hypothetical protein GNI_120130 [Gregarina niphandrodes]